MTQDLEPILRNIIELSNSVPTQADAIVRNITTIPCCYYQKRSIVEALRAAGLPKDEAKSLAQKAVDTNEGFHRYMLKTARRLHDEVTDSHQPPQR